MTILLNISFTLMYIVLLTGSARKFLIIHDTLTSCPKARYTALPSIINVVLTVATAVISAKLSVWFALPVILAVCLIEAGSACLIVHRQWSTRR